MTIIINPDIDIDLDFLDIVPIVVPPQTPVPVDNDASGTVVSGDGSTDNAQSLTYALSGLVSMAWAQEPFRVIWAARSDGLLLGCTYRRDQGVLAWHRHPMTNGAVEDVAVIPDPETGKAQVWMLVQRVIDGNTVRYLEYMTPRHEPDDITDTEDYNYLDCSLTYSGSPATTISNLDHLEGQTVQIWADGTRHDDKTVSGGSITLDREASKVHVGIHSASYARVLPLEQGGGDGVHQGKMKLVNKVRLRFYETIGGKIGKTLDALDPINLRSADDNIGGTPNLVSGMVEAGMGTFYDRDGQFYIVQDFPAPMTVAALVPEVDGSDF